MNAIPSSSVSKKRILVACDDGYAETKVVLEDGSAFRFPSMVRQGGILGASSDEVHSYETAGANGSPVVYTATGDFDNEAANTRFDGYPFSAENRVMIQHALRRAGLGDCEVSIATSLPVSDYFDSDAPALARIEQKSTNVMKAVRSLSGAPGVLIVGSRVYPEGVAAWIDFVLDEKGNYRHKPKRAAAVVDIGGRTTDTVKILSQMTVQQSNSGTAAVGVLNLYDEMAMAMARHPEMLANFPGLKAAQITRSMVTEVLGSGVYQLRDIAIDLAAEVKAAKQLVANRILRDVESRISTGIDLERLLFVGGGAAVFEHEIKARYKMAEFVQEPEFANARGMLKSLKYI